MNIVFLRYLYVNMFVQTRISNTGNLQRKLYVKIRLTPFQVHTYQGHSGLWDDQRMGEDEYERRCAKRNWLLSILLFYFLLPSFRGHRGEEVVEEKVLSLHFAETSSSSFFQLSNYSCLKRWMRYVNSILLLRAINIFLLFFLLLQLNSVIDLVAHWKAFFGSRRRSLTDSSDANQNVSSADARPLHIPLPAGTLRLEAIRLNELFARPQHKCADRRVLGGHKDSFFVCFDPEFLASTAEGGGEMFGSALSISGQKKAAVSARGKLLETELNVSSWTLLVPERNQLVEALQTDVFLQFMSELEDEGQFPRDRISNTLATQQSFQLAKLDLDTELLAPGQRSTEARVELLSWIMKRLKTTQLLLVLRPGMDGNSSNKDVEGKVLLAWYRFFYALFFRWNYALLGVRSNGRCGQALQTYDPRHCEWRASFVHFPDFRAAHDVPAYGIGSPLEEKLRFLRYLSSSNNCVPFEGLPLVICPLADGQLFEQFVYFRHRPLLDDGLGEFERLLERTEKLALFVCLDDIGPLSKTILAERSQQFTLRAAGISHSLNASDASSTMPMRSGGFCPLQPLAELLHSVPVLAYQRNALLLDLDGGEWDVLGPITESRQICEQWLRSFDQIAFRIRVWAMEESENWRHFYLWLLRLEECQFRKAFAAPASQHQQQDGSSSSTFLLTYKRQPIVPVY